MPLWLSRMLCNCPLNVQGCNCIPVKGAPKKALFIYLAKFAFYIPRKIRKITPRVFPVWDPLQVVSCFSRELPAGL